MPKLDRRAFLASTMALCAAPAAGAGGGALLADARLRGGIDAGRHGVRAGRADDQSRAFSRLLDEAAATGQPVYLPAGDYHVSNITLPKRVVLTGVPGATRLIHGGGGHFLLGIDGEQVILRDLVLDGMNRTLADDVQALVDLRAVAAVELDGVTILGSSRNGVALELCAGRIERCTISGAADAGLWSVEGAGLTVAGNSVTDCGNGGILATRWTPAEDGTVIAGNRVARIAALAGGTGQHGNGINLFQAHGAVVSDNSIAGCAFSAIRANGASAARISGNRCVESGETAIYAEFAFEGAAITGNLVDGAANGISVVNFDRGGRLATVTGNIVRNLRRDGPYPADAPGFGAGISVEADTAVTGNLVEGAPLWGIGIGWGPYLRDVAVTGNVVRASRIGVAVSVVDGAGAALITDNLIAGASAGAIVGHRWAEPATGDLAVDGAAGYGHLTVERNRVS